MHIKNCRVCNSLDIECVVDLGNHPLADTFLSKEMLNLSEVYYPLKLGLCNSCGHVFTLFTISPVERYQKNDYSYDSSNSIVSIEHFKEFASTVVDAMNLNIDSLIVDIGSNVGTLLGQFKALGYQNVLGVEPSKNISLIAESLGIRTICDFFSEEVVKKLQDFGKVKLLLSSNVVNHADDLNGLLDVVKKVLDKDGLFIFEVPYLMDLIKNTAFDTIYHEHVHYYGMKSLNTAFLKAGLYIYKVEKIDYMCGSLRVYARVGGQTNHTILAIIDEEIRFGLYKQDTYKKFMERVKQVKISVNNYIYNVQSSGGRVIGIGAATKGNTFINYCGLDSDSILYVTESSNLKIGKYTPGSRILIKSDKDISKDITHAIILPWNIADYLIDKLSHLNLEFFAPQINK